MIQEEFKVRLDEVIKGLKKQKDLHEVEATRENILSYSDINLNYGALPKRPFKDFKRSVDDENVINPMDAEQTDRMRQQKAREHEPTPLATPDKKVLEALVKLGTQPDKFLPFSLERNVTNSWIFITSVLGVSPTAETLKQRYIEALNKIQNTSIPMDAEHVVISFDNPELINNLVREGLINPPNVQGHIFPPAIRDTMAQRIVDAFTLIKAVDIDLHDMIMQFIGTIVCINREGSSGTVSSMVGLIWLNPSPAWSVADYAENIVHEFIHNTIFLGDLVKSIFSTPHWYAPEDSLVVSAIKQYPRGVNIAFHSLYVAAGLIIFLQKARQDQRALDLTAGVPKSIDGLLKNQFDFLAGYGQELLAEVSLNRKVPAAK